MPPILWGTMKKKSPVREFITPERRVEIESEIRTLERQLSGGDDSSSDGVGFMKHAVAQVQNPDDIKRQIQKQKKHLQEGTPKPFATEAQANQAYTWAKKAEKYIRENRPEVKDPRYPKPGRKEHEFARGVENMVEWYKKGKKVESTYRYIMRRLDPTNPNAGRI